MCKYSISKAYLSPQNEAIKQCCLGWWGVLMGILSACSLLALTKIPTRNSTPYAQQCTPSFVPVKEQASYRSNLHFFIIFLHMTSTAGWAAQCKHTKNQFANQPRGLRRIQDQHQKALTKVHPLGGCIFLFR